MEEERSENGVTLGELCRLILKRIWIVLGTAVLVMLAAAILFEFALNPVLTSYEMDLRIVYPGSSDLKYPDGSPFYYQEMITEDSLAAAKASDERFASIDIEKMVDKGAVEITAETENVATGRVYTGQYHISVKMSYFPNKQVATDFIKALAALPGQKVNEIASSADYTLDASVFENASFSVRLDLLASQKANITEQYKAWVELLGSSYRIGETGKTLFSYASEARSAFDQEDKLRLKLDQYDFQTEDVASERKALEAEYEVNLRKIAALEMSANSISRLARSSATASEEGGVEVVFPEIELTTDQMIQKLKTRNEDIITLLGKYEEGKFDGEGTLKDELPAFVKELNRQFAELKETAETTSLVSKALYRQETYTRFETQNAEEEGGVSLIIVALGGLVLGFVVACVVVWIVDYPKYKRAKNQPQPAEEGEQATEKTEE